MSSPEQQRFALFPLNLVLFPGGLLQLRIFEPRYLRMVSECLKENRPFVVAAIVDGPEAGGVAKTAPTGTLARIIDWTQQDDGLLGLLCEGESRCRILNTEIEADQLLRAGVEYLPDRVPAALPESLGWTADILNDLLMRLGEPYDRLVQQSPDAGHVANRLIELLPVPLTDKQLLFDLADGVERLQRVAGLIDPRVKD